MGDRRAFDVRTVRLGPLPLLDHFLDRLEIASLLERFVPTTDRRCRLPYAKSLGVLLRSILVERAPLYRQQEAVASFAPGAFGLSAEDARNEIDQIVAVARHWRESFRACGVSAKDLDYIAPAILPECFFFENPAGQ